jgi:hypothetical protein
MYCWRERQPTGGTAEDPTNQGAGGGHRSAGALSGSDDEVCAHSWDGWCGVLRALAVFSLLAAAAIHGAQIRPHFAEWWAAGIFFVLVALAELALAASVALRVSRWNVNLAILVSLATIAVWSLSRTTGLPFGPQSGTPEPIATPDLIATGMEFVTAATLLLWKRVPAGSILRHRSARNAAIVLAAVVATSFTWAGVHLAPACGPSHGSAWPFGPLVPIDGHSMLSRHTPIAHAPQQTDVGVVVGLFRNCGGSDAVVHSAHVLTATGTAARPVRFWVAPLSTATPGTAVSARALTQKAVPLPGVARIPPAVRPSWALVLEVRTSKASGGLGGFGPAYTVDGFRVRYAAEGRSFEAPFASIGRLRIMLDGPRRSP